MNAQAAANANAAEGGGEGFVTMRHGTIDMSRTQEGDGSDPLGGSSSGGGGGGGGGDGDGDGVGDELLELAESFEAEDSVPMADG